MPFISLKFKSVTVKKVLRIVFYPYKDILRIVFFYLFKDICFSTFVTSITFWCLENILKIYPILHASCSTILVLYFLRLLFIIEGSIVNILCYLILFCHNISNEWYNLGRDKRNIQHSMLYFQWENTAS